MSKKEYVWENESTLTRHFPKGEFVIEEVFRWKNKKGKTIGIQVCWYPPGDFEWIKNDYGGYTRKSALEEYGEEGLLAIWAYCSAGYLTKLKWKLQDILGCN